MGGVRVRGWGQWVGSGSERGQSGVKVESEWGLSGV